MLIPGQAGFVILSQALYDTGPRPSLAKSGPYRIAMSRFLTWTMIVILLIAHASSVAAAVCRHPSGAEHVAARQSPDAGISAVAHGEERARKAASEKGSPSDRGSVPVSSDMLPATGVSVPFRVNEAPDRSQAEPRVLVGASVRPLLEPPAA